MKKPSLLLVESYDTHRNYLAGYLAEMCHRQIAEVIAAERPETALRLFQDCPEKYGLIIASTCQDSIESTLDFLRQVQAQRKDLIRLGSSCSESCYLLSAAKVRETGVMGILRKDNLYTVDWREILKLSLNSALHPQLEQMISQKEGIFFQGDAPPSLFNLKSQGYALG